MAIGQRIVSRLSELGWDRKNLFEKLPDLSQQALSNLIRRDSKRSEWDEEIAKALGVSVLWLVYGIESSTGSAHQPNNHVKNQEANQNSGSYRPKAKQEAVDKYAFLVDTLGLESETMKAISALIDLASKSVSRRSKDYEHREEIPVYAPKVVDHRLTKPKPISSKINK